MPPPPAPVYQPVSQSVIQPLQPNTAHQTHSVVEKCLQYGSKAERNDIIDEVVRSVMEK